MGDIYRLHLVSSRSLKKNMRCATFVHPATDIDAREKPHYDMKSYARDRGPRPALNLHPEIFRILSVVKGAEIEAVGCGIVPKRMWYASLDERRGDADA